MKPIAWCFYAEDGSIAHIGASEAIAKCLASMRGKEILQLYHIPSDKVVVDREEWELLNTIAKCWTPPFGVPQNTTTQSLFDRLDALRAQAKEGGET